MDEVPVSLDVRRAGDAWSDEVLSVHWVGCREAGRQCGWRRRRAGCRAARRGEALAIRIYPAEKRRGSVDGGRGRMSDGQRPAVLAFDELHARRASRGRNVPPDALEKRSAHREQAELHFEIKGNYFWRVFETAYTEKKKTSVV